MAIDPLLNRLRGTRRMNDLERFLAVVNGESPDYVPIFGFHGAPGMSRGCMAKTHDRLVRTGMPSWVGGNYGRGLKVRDVDSWYRYWGTTGPIALDFSLVSGARGFRTNVRVEDGYEIVESETGAITRQVVDNDITYIMPEFIRYAVRDRESWEFYKERSDPLQVLSPEELESRCRSYDNREGPLTISAGGGYGFIRGLMGPEAASYAFYDDPELIHDMMAWKLEQTVRAAFPLIERLRPEIVQMGEDLCYNHGMLISPDQFRTFFRGYYRQVCDHAHANGVSLVAVDTDGNAMEFSGLAASLGVDGIYPWEVKAGNDLFRLREQLPEFVCLGWLEKETVNKGNEEAIEPEIMSKVPSLLAQGRYFPNGDHGIQPLVTFPSLCRFMTLLHEVCNNPEGEFPRC